MKRLERPLSTAKSAVTTASLQNWAINEWCNFGLKIAGLVTLLQHYVGFHIDIGPTRSAAFGDESFGQLKGNEQVVLNARIFGCFLDQSGNGKIYPLIGDLQR